MAAYNSYYPSGYAGFQPYVPTYQPLYAAQSMQPPIQAQVPQPAPAIQQTGILWVASESEAMAYPVAPNNAVTLWNQNEPIVYVKQADASGKPSMKTYDLIERAAMASDAPRGKDGQTISYATKDDVAAVVGAVNGLDGALATFKGEIETIKGDLYGIAGQKKKPVRKTESDSNE